MLKLSKFNTTNNDGVIDWRMVKVEEENSTCTLLELGSTPSPDEMRLEISTTKPKSYIDAYNFSRMVESVLNASRVNSVLTSPKGDTMTFYLTPYRQPVEQYIEDFTIHCEDKILGIQ